MDLDELRQISSSVDHCITLLYGESSKAIELEEQGECRLVVVIVPKASGTDLILYYLYTQYAYVHTEAYLRCFMVRDSLVMLYVPWRLNFGLHPGMVHSIMGLGYLTTQLKITKWNMNSASPFAIQDYRMVNHGKSL